MVRVYNDMVKMYVTRRGCSDIVRVYSNMMWYRERSTWI